MDNRFGYFGMDFNLRPPIPENVGNNASVTLPYLYYPGVPKPPTQHGVGKVVRGGGAPLAPSVGPPVSVGGGSRSFAAALRNLAKQAGPASERDGEVDGRSSPKRPPPPPLVRGPSPPPVKLPDKDRGGEQRSGFQPYRPEEPRVPPPPHFTLDYPAYHPHPALYPPPHHPMHHYRLEEQMYHGVPPLFSSYPHAAPLYGLMPTPLGLMTPAMHERLKLEEEHRQREQERERREKNKKSPRASPSHSQPPAQTQPELSARKPPITTACDHPQRLVPQPHFVRPFEDPFIKPVKKPSPPNCTVVPPPQLLCQAPSLVSPQLPPPAYHPPPPRPLDITNLVPAVATACDTSTTTITSTLTPVIAITESSEPPRIMSCNRITNKLKSRLDSVGEDLSPSLVLTKGPPDKLDASPHKLRFLATFGLTTLTTRNELELTKMSRCKSLPNVVVEGEREGPLPTHPPPPLSLPHPRQSPRSLPHTHTKLAYMTSLQLCPLSHDQRKEREVMWQEVLAERRRRKAVTPLVQYCSEARVNSPDYCSARWLGLEGVLHAYHQYHTERHLEASVLREECARLQSQLAARQGEASALQWRLEELRTGHASLVRVGHDSQRSLDTLMAAVRALMALGHSND